MKSHLAAHELSAEAPVVGSQFVVPRSTMGAACRRMIEGAGTTC